MFGLLTARLLAQQPETIWPITYQMKSEAHYAEQAALWEKVLEQEPQNTSAWLNYYTAARNVNLLTQQQQYDLQQIVEGVSTNIPGTFEYYYLSCWQHPLPDKPYEYILKAHEMSPERWEAYHSLMTHYELEGKRAQRSAYSQRWYDSGMVSPGLLNWNYNLLMSVPKEAVLLVQGDNDTYPIWVLQDVLQVQPRTAVFNVYLLAADEDYRERAFQQLGIRTPLTLPIAEDLGETAKAITQHIATYGTRSLYLSMGLAQQMGEALPGESYLAGLAYWQTEEPVDNTALLRQNVEQRFLTDQLLHPIAHDRSASVVDRMNWNYLPALSLLHRHYEASGSSDQAERVRDLALAIAERAGREEEAAGFFAFSLPVEVDATGLDFKALEKQMKPIGEGVFASETEVSNGEYEVFLSALLRQRQYDLLNRYKIHPTDWVGHLPEAYRDQPASVLYKNYHPDDEGAPVVNISYESAQAYCEWLTNAYNQWSHKRKKYQSVRFYLPSEAEWVRAAKGGLSGQFPWGSTTVTNDDGCYLANINPHQGVLGSDRILVASNRQPESPGEDGAYFPVKVDAYHPNKMGLYNMSGNAAEMIAGGQHTMGGGWLSSAQAAAITAKGQHQLPHPEVGFRIFMQITTP